MKPTHKELVTYGQVAIGRKTWVGNYCVIGYPKEKSIVKHLTEEAKLDDIVAPVNISAKCILGNYVCIYEGVQISSGTVVEDYVRVGYDTKIGKNVRILYGAFICDRVTIQDDARVAGFICDDTRIGKRSTVMGDLVHEYSRPHEDWWEVNEIAPVIDNDVIIGYGANVVGGVRISSHVYIASGAVVTRDVPPNHVVRGVNEQIPFAEWKGKKLSRLIEHWTKQSPSSK